MAKTFKITEEQYRMAMNEGVELSVKPKAGESDPQAFRNFFKDANIDLEQQIEKSVREFSAEFLGGENA